MSVFFHLTALLHTMVLIQSVLVKQITLSNLVFKRNDSFVIEWLYIFYIYKTANIFIYDCKSLLLPSFGGRYIMLLGKLVLLTCVSYKGGTYKLICTYNTSTMHRSLTWAYNAAPSATLTASLIDALFLYHNYMDLN